MFRLAVAEFGGKKYSIKASCDLISNHLRSNEALETYSG
jgi:hypothetical protein